MPPVRSLALRAAALTLSVALAACQHDMKRQEEEEAARNTVVCEYAGERLLIRYDVAEARLLFPGGDRVSLYEIPVPVGKRFSNGNYELRGRGMDLELLRNGAATLLVDCKQYVLPPAK
jgi:hypothetical protein